MAAVILGRLFKVLNTKRPKLTRAAPHYNLLWVEDENGGNERPIMLTDSELKSAEERAKKNPEDIKKRGFLQNILD